jgi:hypothetical protein
MKGLHLCQTQSIGRAFDRRLRQCVQPASERALKASISKFQIKHCHKREESERSSNTVVVNTSRAIAQHVYVVHIWRARLDDASENGKDQAMDSCGKRNSEYDI